MKDVAVYSNEMVLSHHDIAQLHGYTLYMAGGRNQ